MEKATQDVGESAGRKRKDMAVFLVVSLISILVVLSFTMGFTLGMHARMQKITEEFIPLFMPPVAQVEQTTARNTVAKR